MEQMDLVQRGAKVARITSELAAAAAAGDIGLFAKNAEAAVRDELHPEVLAAMLAGILEKAEAPYLNVHGVPDVRRLARISGPSEFAILMIDRGATREEVFDLYPSVRTAGDLMQDALTRLHASGSGPAAVEVLRRGLEEDEELVIPALQLGADALALAVGAAPPPRELTEGEQIAVLCDRLTDCAFRHQPFEIAHTIDQIMRSGLSAKVVGNLLDALHHRMPPTAPRRPDGVLEITDLCHTETEDGFAERLVALGYTADAAQRMYLGATKAAFLLQRCAIDIGGGRLEAALDRLAATFEASTSTLVPACHLVSHMSARMAELLSADPDGAMLRASRSGGPVFTPGAEARGHSEVRIGPQPSWPGPKVDSGLVEEDELGTLPVVADVAASAPWWLPPLPDHVPRWRDRMVEMLALPAVAQSTAQMIEDGRGTIAPATSDTQHAVHILSRQERERLNGGRVWFLGPRATARARAAADLPLTEPVSFDRMPSRSGLVVFSSPVGAYYSKEWTLCTHHPVIPVVAVSWGPFKGGWASNGSPQPGRDEKWWYKRNAGVSDEEAYAWFGDAGSIELFDGRRIPVGLVGPQRGEDGQYQEWVWFTFWTPTGALLKSLPDDAKVSPDGGQRWASVTDLRTFKEHDSPVEWEDELLLRTGQLMPSVPPAGSRLAWARSTVEALHILKLLVDKVADLDGQPLVGREIEVPRRERAPKDGSRRKAKRVKVVDRVTVVDLEEPVPLVPQQRPEPGASGRSWTPTYGYDVEERVRKNHCHKPREHKAWEEQLGKGNCPNHGPVKVKAHRWGKHLPPKPVKSVGKTS